MLFRVIEHEHLIQALAQGLTALYQNIFSEPPYFEVFSDEEVRETLTEYLGEGILLLKYLEREVVGFGAVLPFVKSSLCDMEVVDEDGTPMILSRVFLEEKYGFNAECTWYVSDIGVKQCLRGQGFGTEILSMLITSLPPKTAILLRTSKVNKATQNFYRSRFSFDLMNITTDVAQLRQDGTIQADKRVIMAKVVE